MKNSGSVARSYKTMLGLDAPKSLKEKLAAQNEITSATKVVTKKKEKAADRSGGESEEDSDELQPQFGENTIEYNAVKKIMEEEE